MKFFLLLIALSVLLVAPTCKSPEITTYEESLADFTDLRFGMFLCYNIMSYGAKWGEANYDISRFNPQNLDCTQWAKAAKSANMKFGLLTTKHHEGFCLWDSEVTDYDVAATPYKKDIVRQYVDAFRTEGLKVGLYYSIWDSTHGVDKGNVGTEEMDFIKTQIRELLTKYGKIDYFVVDGWFWRMGHHEVPYTEIRELIRELQPNCLVTDHTHLQAPYHVDIPYFEGPFGAFPQEGNQLPSALGHCSFPGNGWFWDEKTAAGPLPGENSGSVVSKLQTLESRYCNLLLNCMPNRNGLLDPVILDMLTEIGQVWAPDADRPALPTGTDHLVHSIPIKSATASSGDANNLIDAMQYGTVYQHWKAENDSMQVITLDLGIVQLVDILTIVPNHRCKPRPESALVEGNVLEMETFVSAKDGKFRQVATNTWPADHNYRTINFDKTEARYLQLRISSAVGGPAIIAEVEVGLSE